MLVLSDCPTYTRTVALETTSNQLWIWTSTERWAIFFKTKSDLRESKLWFSVNTVKTLQCMQLTSKMRSTSLIMRPRRHDTHTMGTRITPVEEDWRPHRVWICKPETRGKRATENRFLCYRTCHVSYGEQTMIASSRLPLIVSIKTLHLLSFIEQSAPNQQRNLWDRDGKGQRDRRKEGGGIGDWSV